MTKWLRLVVPFALWSALAAAQEAPAQAPMSLREAVTYGLEHSPELKMSQAEVRRRQGAVTSARSLLMPQVDLSADASRTRFEHGYPFGAPPSLLRFDTALYTGSADVKFLAWDFGRTELELAAARERVEAARGGADRLRQELVFEIARLYLQTLAHTDLIDAAEARAKSLRSLLDLHEPAHRGGPGRAGRCAEDPDTPRAGRKRPGHVGVGPPLVSERPGSHHGFRGRPPRADLHAGVINAASAARSRRRAAAPGSRQQAGTCRTEITRSEPVSAPRQPPASPPSRASIFAPRSSSTGSNNPLGFPQLIGRLLPAFPATAASAGNAATDWLIGVHVSVPLFDGGRRRGQVQAAVAQAEEARLARQQSALRVGREVRTALADLESAESRVKALRESVAESERVLHDERVKYEAGRSVINFVLDAESALLTNQSLLSQAERSAMTAGLALDLSVGRIDISRLSDGR